MTVTSVNELFSLYTFQLATSCSVRLKITDVTNRMEIITGQPGPTYIPRVSKEEASQLFTKLYRQKVTRVKSLIGYMAQNFHIQTETTNNGTPEEYVLKILTFERQNMRELTDISIKFMLYLRDCGIVCSVPLLNVAGDYLTEEEVMCCKVSPTSGKCEEDSVTQSVCLVYALTFLPGKQLEDVCPKSVPLSWFKDLGQYLAKVDKVLLDFPHKECIPAMTEYGESLEWSLNTVPRYRTLLHMAQDESLRNLIEGAINDFDNKVVPTMPRLRKAMIYNDFNHNNIIVNMSSTKPTANNPEKMQIVGIIDFNDICYTYLLFDIGIALTYMLMIQKKGDRLATGQQFLQAYESVMPLTDDEWELLPVCAAGRCVQTILMGMYSYQKDPSNEYVASDVQKGVDVLKFVRSVPLQELVKAWRCQTTT